MAMDRFTEDREERLLVSFDHAAVTATTTWKVWSCPTGRTFVVDRVSYINVTGLAADGTNAFAGTVQNGSTVMATVFNTDSGDADGAALAADTFVEGTLTATEADRWLEAGDVLSFVVTEDAAATLPAGRVIIEGRLI